MQIEGEGRKEEGEEGRKGGEERGGRKGGREGEGRREGGREGEGRREGGREGEGEREGGRKGGKGEKERDLPFLASSDKGIGRSLQHFLKFICQSQGRSPHQTTTLTTNPGKSTYH